jgi:hypothetical protein
MTQGASSTGRLFNFAKRRESYDTDAELPG